MILSVAYLCLSLSFFTYRGMAPNVTAVAIPIAITIFATDLLKAVKHGQFKKNPSLI